MLTDTAIKAAKAKDKPYNLADERGSYLLVHPNGGKYWRLKYRFGGKQKTLALGTYPDVTLAMARSRRDAARTLLADGIDPGEAKKEKKAAVQQAATNHFEAVAREWLVDRSNVVTERRSNTILAILEADVFPAIGSKPVSSITAPMVLEIMRKIDRRGARFTAHRAKGIIGQVMRHAIAHGRATHNPVPDLAEALPQAATVNMPALTDPKKVAELLRAMDAFEGTEVVKYALLLAPLVFVRPGELRQAEWADIDLEQGEWRFRVTKTKVDHLVPLSTQAVAILSEIQQITGDGRYVFPSLRGKTRPMSDAAINAALRRLGYDTSTEHCAHGFRAMARTLIHEQLKVAPEVIEHQLAHKVSDALGSAYNRTKFLDARVEMMQRWGDYLDKLKGGAEVIRIVAA